MNKAQRIVTRRKKILIHAESSGDVSLTWRHFGIGRATFYRWKAAQQKRGDEGLADRRPGPRHHPNETPREVVEKVLHLRRNYHLGSIRIVWYLARHHGIKISDAGVCRILRRNGLNRLPSGTRVRKVHTKRYNK